MSLPAARSIAVALTLFFTSGMNMAAATDGADRGASADRQQALPPQNLPPIVSFMPGNSGWSANFSFADPVDEIQWSLSQDGPFESTGFVQAYDPQTRRPMAKSNVEIDAAPAVLYVRYADIKGNWVGPFAIAFDPAVEIRRTHRELLEMTTQAWLAFRHDVPNILYYTHVSGYRCAVRELRIGLDKEIPERVVPLAPCESRKDVDTHLWIKPTVNFVSAQLIYYDGVASKVKTFTRAASNN